MIYYLHMIYNGHYNYVALKKQSRVRIMGNFPHPEVVGAMGNQGKYYPCRSRFTPSEETAEPTGGPSVIVTR